jgi:hypothetical protein
VNLESLIMPVWRYTQRPSSCEFGDALGDHDGASLEMHLDALVVRV